MKTKEEIITFLQNEPLIEWRLSAATIDWNTLRRAQGASLFFGVGLCTAKEPAVAIPFDILAFFLVAEKLKRFLDLSKIIVLIADRHALTNPFMTAQIVDTLTQKTETLFHNLIQKLHLDSFEIRRASTMLSTAQTTSLVPDGIPKENPYLTQEIADVVWMSEHDRLILKLGWTIDSALSPSGHDERFFDLVMRPILPHSVSFLFTQAGRTFDRHRQKVSPYISVAGEHRLLLTPSELVAPTLRAAEKQWGDVHMGGARKHLGNIIRLFEQLFGHLPAMTFEEKLQHVLNVTMKGEGV